MQPKAYNETIHSVTGEKPIDIKQNPMSYPKIPDFFRKLVISILLFVIPCSLCLPKEDNFVYTVQLWTKRKILSEIGKLFDPSGFISPTIITAKILIQSL